LIAQSTAALHLAAPFGMSPIALGLAIGVPWGIYATARGRWL
jgi:hypothetical protein